MHARPSPRWPAALLLTCLAPAHGCAGAGSGPGEPSTGPAPAEAAAARITAESSLAHVRFLASDELAGRDTPSPGLETAARYIAERFAAHGLEPAGEEGDWLQRWPYERRTFDRAGARLRATGNAGIASLELGVDWFALPTGAGAVEGTAYYAGRAESAAGEGPEGVRDRIVILETGPSLGPELLGVVRAFGEAGTAALVLVLHPDIPPEAIPAIMAQVEALPPLPLAVAGVSRAGAAALFAAGGDAIDEVLSTGGDVPGGRELGARFEIFVPTTVMESRPPNVAALLRGSDPALARTYVVYTAHFDHVGVGRPDATGDSIFNGADDDASGTALLLEVAGAFAALPEPPARSVLFLAVSGEEKGLLGSRWWAEHPTVSMDNVIANLNFDMVGRNHPDTVIAVGEGYSSLGPLAERVGRERPGVALVVAPDPDPSENAFFRSDHVSFVRRGIPSLFLTTWLHPEYHTPADETGLIDADKLARVARLAFWAGWEVAGSEAAPSWNEGAWEEVERVLAGSPF